MARGAARKIGARPKGSTTTISVTKAAVKWSNEAKQGFLKRDAAALPRLSRLASACPRLDPAQETKTRALSPGCRYCRPGPSSPCRPRRSDIPRRRPRLARLDILLALWVGAERRGHVMLAGRAAFREVIALGLAFEIGALGNFTVASKKYSKPFSRWRAFPAFRSCAS